MLPLLSHIQPLFLFIIPFPISYRDFTFFHFYWRIDILSLLVPVIKTLSENLMVQNNPWTESKLSEGERGPDCRERLRQLLKFSKNGRNRAKCCVTGMPPVICAHLIPCSATSQQLKTVGLTIDDVNSTRNLVFWLGVIERHFDRLQLSFMRTNPLVDNYCLKIWDDSIRCIRLGSSLPASSPQTVGDIEGFEMTLRHPVYTRLLAYQAYQCCVKYSCDDDEIIRQSLYGSPGNYPFRTQSELILADFHKIVAEEIDLESAQDE